MSGEEIDLTETEKEREIRLKGEEAYNSLSSEEKEELKKVVSSLPTIQKEIEKEKNKIKPTEEIFSRVKRVLKKYLDTTELNYNLLTTWTLGTYFHFQFETYPLLTLMARKQSGKTRTFKLLSSLAKGSDGSVSTSITETFLFRHKEGSIFFDEMESLSSKDKTALRELINAVYKKGNKIIRYKEKRTPEGKEYVEEEFRPFYPLGIANIYGFGDVLLDRSLQLILQRSYKKQTQLIEDFSTNPEILMLKIDLNQLDAQIPQDVFSEWNKFILGKGCNEKLKKVFSSISETKISGRPLEIFFPLFLVGEIFGVLNLIINCSEEYLGQLEGEFVDNIDDLLQDFLDKRTYEGYTTLSHILKEFRGSLESPDEWINSKWFGRALKRLGMIDKKRLVNGRVQVLLKSNSTNSTNTINTTNSTNPTKEVELGEFVEFRELGEKVEIIKMSDKFKTSDV